MQTIQGLSNLQLELLKIYSFNISNEQLLEVKSLLSDYFAEKITKDMDKLFEKKAWDESKIDEWASEHMRTSKQ